MELSALIINTKAVEENANHDRSGTFRFPLNEDEIRERLNFDNDMTGWYIWVPDSPLEDMKEDTPLEEMNQLYFMLEGLEGKIHEKDVKAVSKGTRFDTIPALRFGGQFFYGAGKRLILRHFLNSGSFSLLRRNDL